MSDTSTSSSNVLQPDNPVQFGQVLEIGWREVASESDVRAQTTNEPLEQRISGRGDFPLLLEQGQATAIVPDRDGGGEHRDVFVTSAVGVGLPRNSSLTYTWTFPEVDGERPSLVYFRDQAGAVPVYGNTLTIRYDIDESSHDIYLNGEFQLTRSHNAIVPLPSFTSYQPGLHSVTVAGTGTQNDERVSGTWTYNQKTLRFTEEFPDFDLESEEPIEIVNEFEWDTGSPVVDPSWVVTVDERFTKNGTGTSILASWEPPTLTLARATDQSRPRVLRAGIRAQTKLTELNYDVEARAEGYPATSEYPATRTAINQDGLIPGRASELMVIDEAVNPESPFEEPGASVTVTAKAVLIASELDPADIKWRIELLKPNGEPALDEPYESGDGPDIMTEWDGTLNGQPVDDPGSYQFHIYAEICPDDGGIAFRAIRGQEADPQPSPLCLDDDVLVAINGQAAQIRFFDSTDTEITEMQPSYVFQVRQIADVVNRGGSDPGTQPTERVVPDIGANVVRVEILFNKERPQNEGYLLTVETASGGMRDGGHLHVNPAPPGVVSDTKSDLLKDLNELTDAQKARIGDQGVSIEGKEEYSFIVEEGQKEVTLFYLAPISSNYRKFTLTRRTDSRKFADKFLIVGINGLIPLATTLAAKSIPYVEDPVRGPYPEEPPGGILLTGKKENIHHQNLNGTPDFNNRLAKLAEIWIKNEKQRTLRFNDMSLPEGGKFSIDGIYELREKHTEHRVGENIDTNTDIIREKNRDPKFEDYIDQAGLAVYLELEDIHYHLRYLHEE